MRVAAILACLLVAGCLGASVPDRPDRDDSESSTTSSSSTADSAVSPSSSSSSSSSSASPDSSTLDLWVVDIGQGAALVLQLGGKTMLVDSADRTSTSTNALLDFFEAHGITVIDDWVQGQADSDHSGGCREVFAEAQVLEFYHPGNPKDTVTWRECLEGAEAEGMPIYTDAQLNVGSTLDWAPGATVTVLNIDQASSTINEGSLAIWVRFGDMDIVLPSDIGCATEEKVLASFPDLTADVLQAGHHGSAGSTCAPWLSQLQPDVALIPVGAGNPYGHPTNATLSRLAAVGATVYRSDLHGDIHVQFTTTSYTVSVERGNTTAPPSSTSSSSSSSTSASPPPANGGLSVGALMGDDTPCRYGTASVNVVATRMDGTPAAGATVSSVWHYKSSSSSPSPSTTGSDGTVIVSRSIGGASEGYQVRVVLTVTLPGLTGTAETFFTPVTC